jgi:hypothetical protein
MRLSFTFPQELTGSEELRLGRDFCAGHVPAFGQIVELHRGDDSDYDDETGYKRGLRVVVEFPDDVLIEED